MAVTLETIMEAINSNKDVLNDLKASATEIGSKVSMIEATFTSISNELSATKQEVSDIKMRLDVVENIQTNQYVVNNEMSSSINKLMQLSKASELSIHNLPPEFDKAFIISSFSTWSGILFNENSFKHSSLITSKKGTSATLYLDFNQESLKNQFMHIVKA